MAGAMMMSQGAHAGAAAANAATVSVSGETIFGFSFGQTAYAGVYFYEAGDASGREGTVRKQTGVSTFSQIDVATDWIRPTNAATTSYRIKYSSYTGTSPTGATISTAYQAISTDRYVYIIDNSPTFGGATASFTIHIDNGTTELDTGSYTLEADREDF